MVRERQNYTPLLLINKTDKRFIDTYGVLDNINIRTNLAAMDWNDFENLSIPTSNVDICVKEKFIYYVTFYVKNLPGEFGLL